MILPATLFLIYGTSVVCYVLLNKNIMKSLVPILGIVSIIAMLVCMIMLTAIDSPLLFNILKGSFVTFCVLLPLNFILNKS